MSQKYLYLLIPTYAYTQPKPHYILEREIRMGWGCICNRRHQDCDRDPLIISQERERVGRGDYRLPWLSGDHQGVCWIISAASSFFYLYSGQFSVLVSPCIVPLSISSNSDKGPTATKPSTNERTNFPGLIRASFSGLGRRRRRLEMTL